MKIRFANMELKHIILDQFLQSKYCIKKSSNNIIYSDNGLFYVVSDKIYKINTTDHKCSETVFSYKKTDYTAVMDKSTTSKERYLSQIPINHVMVQQELIYLKLQSNSMVSCVLERLNGNVRDLYFETSEEIDNHSVIEDICTLLSVIYLY